MTAGSHDLPAAAARVERRDSIPPEPRVLLVTGTCGSGKTTVATLLGRRPGWSRVSADDLWSRLFGRDRGAFGSSEHRLKRARVNAAIFAGVMAALGRGDRCVIDATVHEAPPEAFAEFRAFFAARRVPWMIRVLHPSLASAIARDAARPGWHAGASRVTALRAKFTGREFPAEWFVDTTGQTPEETVACLLAGLAAPRTVTP